eukprot:Plantae.Rhodophyta-Hildenbrandia_rubra.ctg1403.p2 GENE.Plantae.Rhodophyta-Hildenbrandia_rubra.ctg1403~~Plantae.Rhodophyta-Hildenbrandia_rubra.ctg1403.p2  ORF type:complete len:119 (+),score=15.13 Plantae.Rhodophyta-Hildenbrandia_rubra.ctg1403:998-1354(+)
MGEGGRFLRNPFSRKRHSSAIPAAAPANSKAQESEGAGRSKSGPSKAIDAKVAAKEEKLSSAKGPSGSSGLLSCQHDASAAKSLLALINEFALAKLLQIFAIISAFYGELREARNAPL